MLSSRAGRQGTGVGARAMGVTWSYTTISPPGVRGVCEGEADRGGIKTERHECGVHVALQLHVQKSTLPASNPQPCMQTLH
jgi:hypothetical protein